MSPSGGPLITDCHWQVSSSSLHASLLQSTMCICRAVTHLAKEGHLHVFCHLGSPTLGDMKHLCVCNSFLQIKHRSTLTSGLQTKCTEKPANCAQVFPKGIQ